MDIRGESLVLAKTDAGKLCFDRVVKGSVVVRTAYKADDGKSFRYREGVDYIVDYARGTLSRTGNSSIPDFSKNVLYGQKDFDHTRFPGFTNLPFFVWVDYKTENGQPFAKPNNQLRFLPETLARLKAGETLKIVSYGDSITAGGEASSPELRFTTLFGNYLQRRYPKAKITVEDASISGYTSTQGIEWWDRYLGKTSPDLVLVGFGMNDHNRLEVGGNEPAVYKKNLITLVGMIRERKGAEVILFPAFPPHNDWRFGTHRMDLFAQAAREAAAETGCAYADVYDTWMMVLKRKDQSSLLANNINHPNDFGHWLYEQAFEAIGFE